MFDLLLVFISWKRSLNVVDWPLISRKYNATLFANASLRESRPTPRQLVFVKQDISFVRRSVFESYRCIMKERVSPQAFSLCNNVGVQTPIQLPGGLIRSSRVYKRRPTRLCILLFTNNHMLQLQFVPIRVAWIMRCMDMNIRNSFATYFMEKGLKC